MTEHAFMSFVLDPARALPLMSTCGLAADCNRTDSLHTVDVPTDSDEYRKLVAALRREGVAFDERLVIKFSEEERRSAAYLVMEGGNYAGYPWPESSYQSDCFDQSKACPQCGNGAPQIRPLGVAEVNFNKADDCFELHWEYVYMVRDRLRHAMEAQRFTGLEFWPVIDARTKRAAPGWSQLVVTSELPPMAKNTVLPLAAKPDSKAILEKFGLEYKEPCACGRYGWNVPELIYYDADVASNFQDFNLTREWLGGGDQTYQLTIVSQRAYRFFRESGIDIGDFRPVLLA